MNNSIKSKTINLTIKLIKDGSINKLKIENYNLKELIKINILILIDFVLILILKYLLFHNSILKFNKVILLIITLRDLQLLKDNLLIGPKVEKRNQNLNLNLKMLLNKGFLSKKCMRIVYKKHQIRFIKKSRNL